MKPKDVPKRCTWNQEKEEWRCKKCGSLILGHEQTVSLHMHPNSGMPLAGFGETTRRIVPYCPKCEREPSDCGIGYYDTEDDPDVQDLRVIKKMGELR